MFITHKDQEVLKRVLEYQRGHRGLPPTMGEIADSIGVKSRGAVLYHLRKLVELGLAQETGAKNRKYKAIDSQDSVFWEVQDALRLARLALEQQLREHDPLYRQVVQLYHGTLICMLRDGLPADKAVAMTWQAGGWGSEEGGDA